MSVLTRKTRLIRLVSALDKLRQIEIAKQFKATASQAEAQASAKTLDAIDLGGSDVWSRFPQNWLNYRSKLDREVINSVATIEACSKEALRLEKVAERIVKSINKIEADEAEKQAANEIIEFVSMKARSQQGLGKFDFLDKCQRKR